MTAPRNPGRTRQNGDHRPDRPGRADGHDSQNPVAHVDLHDPGQLAAAVPHLIGFRPADSLTAIALTGGDPAQIGITIRVDLPPPWHARLVAEEVVRPLRTHATESVVLVLYGSAPGDPTTPAGGWTGPDESGPPHRTVVAVLHEHLADAGIALQHACWAPRCEPGQTWWCYEDLECTGQLPDPFGTELAAATAISGGVTFGSRDELAAVLRPAPSKVLRRTAALLCTRPPFDAPQRPLSLLLDAMDRVDDLPQLTTVAGSERVADLACALRQPDVRTACMAMALDERAPGAERLWTALTRATPPPWRVEPACLLAISTYLRGNGALASLAVDRALEADPDHGLATLLQHALVLALPPTDLRRMLTELTTSTASGDPDLR